ncbi:MAG TPA: GNAT family N-acetyltransferase [Acidimicrobiales bacterium]|jgi:phosphinothricin acetyltransferase
MIDAGPEILIRRATLGDAEAIADIYNAEVTTSTAVFDIEPRSTEAQRRWIGDRTGAYPAIVATIGDEVMGFGSLSRYRDRPAYATTVEDSVYVHRDHRGLGVGRRLLDHLVALASDHGFHTVIARVADGNAGSVRLHEACGFAVISTEREVGRKFGRWLDVVVLQRML